MITPHQNKEIVTHRKQNKQRKPKENTEKQQINYNKKTATEKQQTNYNKKPATQNCCTGGGEADGGD